MNPELLRKCLSGQADASEWITYQLWLEGDPNLEEPAFPAEAQHDQEDRIWSRIGLQNQQYTKLKRYRKRFVLSAAASLMLVCIFAILGIKYSSYFTGTMAFKGTDHPLEEKEFDGLRFKLGKDSEVKMQDTGGDRMDVQFAGNMMLSNTSGRDRVTEIFYRQANGEQMRKQLRLKKDRTYYLASNSSNKDQLLIVEDRAFRDMPPVLARNLKSEFNQF